MKRNRRWLPTIVACLWAGTLLAISFTPIVTGDFLTRHRQSMDTATPGLDDALTHKQHPVRYGQQQVSDIARRPGGRGPQTAQQAELSRRYEDKLHSPHAEPVSGNPPLDIPFDMNAVTEHAERRFAYEFKAQRQSHKARSASTSRYDLLEVEDTENLEPGDIMMMGGFTPVLSLDRAPKDAKFELIR